MGELIYLTEDDENIRELVTCTLEAFGFTVNAFEYAESMLDEFSREIPALILLDIMLPGMDGIEALKIIRKNPATKSVPVIMLTAKGTEVDKVKGLDNGADDYITKPFGVLELSARVRAALRRSGDILDEQKGKNTIETHGISINTDTREVFVNNQKTDLTLKEFELLKSLVLNKDRVVTRDELLSTVWGFDYAGETRTLDMHIRSLRNKLNDDAENPRFIKTIRGVGYRFNG